MFVFPELIFEFHAPTTEIRDGQLHLIPSNQKVNEQNPYFFIDFTFISIHCRSFGFIVSTFPVGSFSSYPLFRTNETIISNR